MEKVRSLSIYVVSQSPYFTFSVVARLNFNTSKFRFANNYSQAKTLQFLDISQNPLDRKSIESIGSALGAANEGGLVSLRLDDCALKPIALESLGIPICSAKFYY